MPPPEVATSKNTVPSVVRPRKARLIVKVTAFEPVWLWSLLLVLSRFHCRPSNDQFCWLLAGASTHEPM